MASGTGLGEKLTSREIDVLKLVASGLSSKQIARSLGVAFKTATCHRSRIMAKLDIHQVADLTRYAIRNGYVDLGSANARREDIPPELFKLVRTTEAKYRQAVKQYSAFLQDRESIGLTNPDSSTGARQLRNAEEWTHREYHAALVALKEFLFKSGKEPNLETPRDPNQA
jgi:DNA-binding CsgD family transcriptional regulator